MKDKTPSLNKPSKLKEIRYDKLKKQRRFVVVPVDINVFGEMLLNGSAQYRAEGLPNDAIFVHADRDVMQQAFQFIYMHESFKPVPEGTAGPTLLVTLTRINL